MIILKLQRQTIALWFALLLNAVTNPAAQAVVAECNGAIPLEHAFGSGASWTLCVHVDEHHGIELSDVHYRAPGDRLRSVLRHLHVGQILMHYHNESDARPQIGRAEAGRLLPMTTQHCDGERIHTIADTADSNSATLCSRIENNGVLAKFAQRPALHSERWVLSGALQRHSLVWRTSVALTEDGQIKSTVTLSGRAREAIENTGSEFAVLLSAANVRLLRATVLSTWRMVFNLDDGAYDKVEQLDFPLLEQSGNRRPMQVSDINSERFATVDRESFRGWRILDNAGTGYYLDPSNSGFSYSGGQLNWTRFDVGFSRYNDCERYALNNTKDEAEADFCGNSLDDFVNAQSLSDAYPVLWYSQSHTFNPNNEDWPVISDFSQSFTLLPFDWTGTSPFEVIE